MNGPPTAWAFALAVVLAFSACGGGDEPEPTPTPLPTVATTPEPAGFLPTWTPAPPTATPEGQVDGPLGRCPPLPAIACAQPGDVVNPYRELRLDGVSSIEFRVGGPSVRWAYDGESLRDLLRAFDREVTLQPYSIPLSSADSATFSLGITWPSGQGPPWGDANLDQVDLRGHRTMGVIGEPSVGVQMPLPPGFIDGLSALLTDITPTPRPYSSPTPTPVIVPGGTVFFQHPEGELQWNGPDNRVVSQQAGHCGYGHEQFGVPGYIQVGEDISFWGARAIPRQDGWRRTGYEYGEWQIWQGADPLVIYVVHRDEDRIAFEYRSFPCV